jgi:hypothetical protein
MSMHAADQRISTNAPAARNDSAKKQQGLPFYGKLGAFDKAKQTITLDGKEKKRMFYLDSSTRVHRDKQPARLDDLVVGQWVGGFVRPDGDGRPMVVTLNLAVTQRNPSSTSTNTVKIRTAPTGKTSGQ